MLDSETKSRIDSARDILVGKVPDPKSQVEQITIALIYKFMDDMDRQSEELGGKATFFSGEYKKYTWSRLLDNRIGGHERLGLYAEGLDRMNQNKNIPQLFRDIFKGVFLPYRDPETLNLFLKEINGFSYDHSERLGDAFEYLLSVMDSQGSAGQFRTPRHIIDFIVRIVDPKKTETILDPACGTAGFLISSYKHIISQNTKDRPGDQLTVDERGRLMTNFCGYDISPDMVRLSRVNLYLHGFANPRIHEYDTLTSEERWDERYDVILANPPFMTPKGGIRPHNRFSIKATRSEVLFVDYIAEHLNVNGRAGVIVPEGIIFQSQNAYKKLRKMLIENYLWCVVSLPAGCFNPYSGVKTSILLLDKSLAKRTDEILFVKVENDGFDLGAQRRPNGKNDLPQALSAISDFRLRIADFKKEVSDTQKSIPTLTVKKARLLESGDVNLSGDRYRDSGIRVSTKWPMVKLGEVVKVLDSQRKPVKKGDRTPGPYPYYGATGILDFVSEYIFDEELVLVGEDGAKWGPGGQTAFIVSGKCWVNNHAHVLRLNKDNIKPIYLVSVLNEMDLLSFVTGVTVPKLNQEKLRSIEIPLPPLEVQEKIVAELDGYRKIIEGAKQIIANYKPTIHIDPDWPIVDLGEAVEVNRRIIDPSKDFGENEFIYIDISSVENGSGIVSFSNKIRGIDAPSRARRVVQKSDVLLSTVRPNLKAFAYLEDVPKDSLASTGFAVLTPREGLSIGKYIWLMMFEDIVLLQMINRMGKGAYPSINQSDVEALQIPLPPLDIQRRIVEEIEAERELVEANRKLIKIYEQKIQAKLSEILGEPNDAT